MEMPGLEELGILMGELLGGGREIGDGEGWMDGKERGGGGEEEESAARGNKRLYRDGETRPWGLKQGGRSVWE